MWKNDIISNCQLPRAAKIFNHFNTAINWLTFAKNIAHENKTSTKRELLENDKK